MTVRITDILQAGNKTWIEDLHRPENLPTAILRNLECENHRGEVDLIYLRTMATNYKIQLI